MGTKTFPYSVIIDGVIIPANTPIPDVKFDEEKVAEEISDAEKSNVGENRTVERPRKKAGTRNDKRAD